VIKERRAATERRYRGRVEAGDGVSTVTLRFSKSVGWFWESRLKCCVQGKGGDRPVKERLR
jgi:hypothetical protein